MNFFQTLYQTVNHHFNAILYDNHCEPLVQTPLHEQYLSHLLMMITPSRLPNNYYWSMVNQFNQINRFLFTTTVIIIMQVVDILILYFIYIIVNLQYNIVCSFGLIFPTSFFIKILHKTITCTTTTTTSSATTKPSFTNTQTINDQPLKSDEVSSPTTTCQSLNTQPILVSSTQISPIHPRNTSQIIDIVWDIVNDSLKQRSSDQLKLKENESRHKLTKQKLMTSRIPQLRKSITCATMCDNKNNIHIISN